MGFPGTKTMEATIYVLVLPSGLYQVATEIPTAWLMHCEAAGAMIRTVRAKFPVPMQLPTILAEDITDAA